MEDIREILNSIKQHTTAEADAYATNRTIGRGRIKLDKTSERTIWVANVGYQSANSYYTTGDGRVGNISNGVHTYQGGGEAVISKNTAPGRLIMENYGGTHQYVAPAGSMVMKIFNAAYYTQPQGRNIVNDLSVGIAGQPRLLHFQNLDAAMSSYLKLIKDRAETQELIKQHEIDLEKKTQS